MCATVRARGARAAEGEAALMRGKFRVVWRFINPATSGGGLADKVVMVAAAPASDSVYAVLQVLNDILGALLAGFGGIAADVTSEKVRIKFNDLFSRITLVLGYPGCRDLAALLSGQKLKDSKKSAGHDDAVRAAHRKDDVALRKLRILNVDLGGAASKRGAKTGASLNETAGVDGMGTEGEGVHEISSLFFGDTDTSEPQWSERTASNVIDNSVESDSLDIFSMASPTTAVPETSGSTTTAAVDPFAFMESIFGMDAAMTTATPPPPIAPATTSSTDEFGAFDAFDGFGDDNFFPGVTPITSTTDAENGRPPIPSFDAFDDSSSAFGQSAFIAGAMPGPSPGFDALSSSALRRLFVHETLFVEARGTRVSSIGLHGHVSVIPSMTPMRNEEYDFDTAVASARTDLIIKARKHSPRDTSSSTSAIHAHGAHNSPSDTRVAIFRSVPRPKAPPLVSCIGRSEDGLTYAISIRGSGVGAMGVRLENVRIELRPSHSPLSWQPGSVSPRGNYDKERGTMTWTLNSFDLGSVVRNGNTLRVARKVFLMRVKSAVPLSRPAEATIDAVVRTSASYSGIEDVFVSSTRVESRIVIQQIEDVM